MNFDVAAGDVGNLGGCPVGGLLGGVDDDVAACEFKAGIAPAGVVTLGDFISCECAGGVGDGDIRTQAGNPGQQENPECQEK